MENVQTGRHYGNCSNSTQVENNLASDPERTRTAPKTFLLSQLPHLGEQETSSSWDTKKKKSSCVDKGTEIEREKNLPQKGVKSLCNYQAVFLCFCAVFFVCHGCKLGLVVEMATAVNFKE